MNEIFKAIAMQALTGILAFVASRYHLSGDQSAAILTDVLTAISMVTGTVLHAVAYHKEPPK